jgi:hypothetical protein
VPLAGKLTLSGSAVRLTSGANGGAPTGTLVLTATGGPVMGYTITIPASADGLLTASPASGVIGSGQSVTVTFVLARPVSFDQQVSINPGALAVTVEYTAANETSAPGPAVGRVT